MKDFHQATAASRQQINVIFKGEHASTEQSSDSEYQGDSGPCNVFVGTNNILVPNESHVWLSNLIRTQNFKLYDFTVIRTARQQHTKYSKAAANSATGAETTAEAKDGTLYRKSNSMGLLIFWLKLYLNLSQFIQTAKNYFTDTIFPITSILCDCI